MNFLTWYVTPEVPLKKLWASGELYVVCRLSLEGEGLNEDMKKTELLRIITLECGGGHSSLLCVVPKEISDEMTRKITHKALGTVDQCAHCVVYHLFGVNHCEQLPILSLASKIFQLQKFRVAPVRSSLSRLMVRTELGALGIGL